MDDILSVWVRQAEFLAAAFGAVCLVIFLGTVRFAVHMERLAAAREREAVQNQISIQHRRFQNATDNISQGLALYDRNGVLIACNVRFAQIYGLPAAGAGPGVDPNGPLARCDASIFGKPTARPRTESDGGVRTVNALPDGRFIAQRRKDLRGGGWVVSHEDITERLRVEERVRELTTTDVLTGLANRAEFKRRLDMAIADLRRGSSGKFAVLYLDLDNFKTVNDAFGHSVGDDLLREAGNRIATCLRKGDLVAGFGGDEFAILQRVGRLPRDAMKLAERLIDAIAKPFDIDGHIVEIGVSIGIAICPDDSLDAEELVRDAGVALDHAKERCGSYAFFKPAMDEEVRARRQLEIDLRAAVAGNQFVLYFQPVVAVADKSVKSFEALIRWKHPTRGMVSPAEFIPVAEDTGLIVQIGQWVVQEACRQAATWPETIKVAVNVSSIQFKSPGLIKTISDSLRDAGIDGSRLIVEVTESVMIKDAEQAIATLHAVKDLGITVAMDDFGTGYSSLAYLRRFPFDTLKIDRSFVSELDDTQESAAIVRAATGLAKALGMKTVAEGIETEDQLARVGLEGCGLAQGYLISRPMPAEDVYVFIGVEPRKPPVPVPVSASKDSKPAGLKDIGFYSSRDKSDGVARIPVWRGDSKGLAMAPLVNPSEVETV